MLICDLDGPPDPFDVGDFLQAVANIQGVAFALPETEREANYTPTMRTAVVSKLAAPDYVENWKVPDRPGREATFTVDLLVGGGPEPVPAFFASTTAHVRYSVLAWAEMVEREVRATAPVLAYHGRNRIPSNDIKAFQDRAGDDAVIEAAPGEVRGIMRLLAERGAPVTV